LCFFFFFSISNISSQSSCTLLGEKEEEERMNELESKEQSEGWFSRKKQGRTKGMHIIEDEIKCQEERRKKKKKRRVNYCFRTISMEKMKKRVEIC
jgi:hypothetical protein